MQIEQGLYYSKDHEWYKVEGEEAYIGVSDYAQERMGDIVFIDLPEEDDEFSDGDTLCVIESVKAASDIFCTFDCTVVEVNEELEDAPEQINEAPYENWIVKVSGISEEVVGDLMDPDTYEEYIESLAD